MDEARKGKKLKVRKIWHVNYGSRGTAGSYVDSLQKAILKNYFVSLAFVSFRYRYKTRNTVKLFFPFTDRTEKRNIFIYALRYFELVVGYCIVFLGAIIFRPIINIHLIDDLNLTYGFFLLLKNFKLKVFITCHDVLSHQKESAIKRRKMYQKADKLIVHSSYAFDALLNLIGNEKKNKIIMFPFPSSPFEEILCPKRMLTVKNGMCKLIGKDNNYFLFIGVVRNTKGVDTLLDAWAICQARFKHKLIIAGKWAQKTACLKGKAKNLHNCILIDRYLNDEEFIYLIQNSTFTILPYNDYSHSAILFACGWNQGTVILTNIELFKEILPDYELTFPKGNSNRLAALIDSVHGFSNIELENFKNSLKDSVQRINIKLQEDINKLYNE